MKLLTTLLLSALVLTGCAKLHPLEEPAKFQLPHVVKDEDLLLKPKEPIYDNTPEISEIPDDPSKYYVH